MKRLYLILLGLFVLSSVSFVAGYTINELTREDFASDYPQDPLIQTINNCGGRSESECITQMGRDITCIEVAVTTAPNDKPIRKFKCFE